MKLTVVNLDDYRRRKALSETSEIEVPLVREVEWELLPFSFRFGDHYRGDFEQLMEQLVLEF